MTKPMGYFGADYNNPAIASFSEQFEREDGACTLAENDQAALIAVTGTWAWGLRSGLFDDFWQVVDDAIGDGIETSKEADYDDDMPDDLDESNAHLFSPMRRALEAVSQIDHAAQCYSLIAWLLQ